MKTLLITALFCFFCLISCSQEETYRAIEISIINVDYAEVKLYELPKRTLIREQDFDRQYQQTIYFNNVPNGHYQLQVTANNQTRDTTFQYTGVIGVGVEF